MEWWANFINRTDLVRLREVEPPLKPKMSGNIQIVFLMLPSGMSIALIFMIFELHRYVLKILKTFYSAVVKLFLKFMSVVENFPKIWTRKMGKLKIKEHFWY